MSDADERVWQGSSVEIEVGDLFVIVRGEMVHPGGMTIFGSKVPPKFTDQYDGVVFEAMEVCGTMVAAKVHFPFRLAGKTASINLANFETMTITKKYLKQLLTGRKDKDEPKEQMPPQGFSLGDIMKMAQQSGGMMGAGGPPSGFTMPFNLPYDVDEEEDIEEDIEDDYFEEPPEE